MIELGVNLDHVATLREARRGAEPDMMEAVRVCEQAGAHQITAHLRQDRRHMQDRDIEAITAQSSLRLNLEMAAVDEIIAIAHKLRPETVCLVPEKREEITTEGGLEVASDVARLKDVVAGMQEHGIKVSMFVDPEIEQIDASAATGADAVELHTGAYANATGAAVEAELQRLKKAGAHVVGCGLELHAGHGLTVRNLPPLMRMRDLREVNIGHSIISRAVFVGLESAVKEILAILQTVR